MKTLLLSVVIISYIAIITITAIIATLILRGGFNIC